MTAYEHYRLMAARERRRKEAFGRIVAFWSYWYQIGDELI
jgi:hypothetical protein